MSFFLAFMSTSFIYSVVFHLSAHPRRSMNLIFLLSFSSTLLSLSFPTFFSIFSLCSSFSLSAPLITKTEKNQSHLPTPLLRLRQRHQVPCLALHHRRGYRHASRRFRHGRGPDLDAETWRRTDQARLPETSFFGRYRVDASFYHGMALGLAHRGRLPLRHGLAQTLRSPPRNATGCRPLLLHQLLAHAPFAHHYFPRGADRALRRDPDLGAPF